jgi:hypothetical protein
MQQLVEIEGCEYSSEDLTQSYRDPTQTDFVNDIVDAFMDQDDKSRSKRRSACVKLV